jgi:bifunctional DNA-binding transcriptional regulator/antitoxin component of YhaV-PrlF toxin-antitoxin module
MAKTTKGRITIPQNIEENLNLAQKVFDKHKTDAASSLLKNLQDIDWDKLGPEVAICLAKHLEAEELKRKMEEAYRARDLYLPQITEALRVSKSLLKAAFSKNPKKLGDWGFTVDDTPKAKKVEKEKEKE